MKKKVLIISYYWPPAGGISVLRSLKIAKYLTAFDWEPIIYKKLTGRKKEDTLANVLNANDTKKGLFHQLSVWIRANFFIPDARAIWVNPSVKYLTNYLI